MSKYWKNTGKQGNSRPGLEQKMILLAIGGVLLVLILAGILYLTIVEKVFQRFQVERLKISGGTFIYLQYEGNYHKLMDTISKVKDGLQAFVERHEVKLGGGKRIEEEREVRMAGVYYDDPARIMDVNKCRAVLGFILPSSTPQQEVDLFTTYFTQKKYKVKVFEEVSAIGAKFELVGFASLMSSVVRGYPAIKKAMAKDKEQAQCSMEVYEWSIQKLTICFLLGDALLGLSGKPVPPYKS